MSDPGQFVARGREGHTMHPATGAMGELSHNGTKRHLLPPASGLGLLFNLLHISREHSDRGREWWGREGGGGGRERERERERERDYAEQFVHQC